MKILSDTKKMNYNAKVRIDGIYSDFSGWSVVSMVKYHMKFIENFIRKNNVLNKFFSALPTSSYHVTIYNIWCNTSPLLKHQEKFLQKHFPVTSIREKIRKQSQSIGFFNPNGCINDLLFRLYFICEKFSWKDNKLVVKKVHYNGNTIRISFKKCKSFVQMNRCRQHITEACEKKDGMGSYHITLAYKYKDINTEVLDSVKNEIDILNMLLENQEIIIGKPMVSYFPNMTSFRPFEESLM